MRQNNNSSEADIAAGEELVTLPLLETSGAPPHSDSNLIVSQEPPGAITAAIVEDVRAGESNEIVGDMALLSDVVMRPRTLAVGGLTAQDWQDFLAADLRDVQIPTFPPVKIVLLGDDMVHVIDSIEGAVECLTTRWPSRSGEALEGALQSCIDGIKGRVSPQQVRLAFVNAVDEAGILILP